MDLVRALRMHWENKLSPRISPLKPGSYDPEEIRGYTRSDIMDRESDRLISPLREFQEMSYREQNRHLRQAFPSDYQKASSVYHDLIRLGSSQPSLRSHIKSILDYLT